VGKHEEPGNRLDPEGVLWIRNLMKRLAAEGRTVFVSSHLMNEMAVTADHLIVIGRGRVIADSPTAEFIAGSSKKSTLVRSPDAQRLRVALEIAGATVREHDGALLVTGMPTRRIAEVAASGGCIIEELTPQLPSLEEAFMEMTRDSVEYGRPV
jgi:ABC-2 type transport system ATP-binding protein